MGLPGDLPLLVAFVAAVVLSFGLLEALLRNAVLAAGLVLAVSVVDAALVENTPAFSLGAFRLTAIDYVFVLVAAAGVARCLRIRRFTVPQRLLILLCLLGVAGLVRGAATFGPERSVAEFRPFLQLYGGALYFSTIEPSPRTLRVVGGLWLCAAGVLVAVVVARWASSYGGFGLGLVDQQYGAVIRAVSGPQTFFLAHAFVIFCAGWMVRVPSRTQRVLGAVLLVVVVLLNRRAVYLALLAGGLLLLVRNRATLRRFAVPLAAGVVAGGVLVAGLVSASEEPGDRTERLAVSATETSTLDWRIQGWTELLAESPGVIDRLAGYPFGTGYEREVNEQEKVTHPHSLYVTVALRTGLIGLVLLLWLYGRCLRALIRPSPRWNGPYREALLVMAVSQLVWFFAWLPGVEQGILTGLLVSVAGFRPAGSQEAAAWHGGPVGVTRPTRFGDAYTA